MSTQPDGGLVKPSDDQKVIEKRVQQSIQEQSEPKLRRVSDRCDNDDSIEIKTSTELISDEYAHDVDKHMSVYIFNGDETDQENVSLLENTFESIDIPKNNIHQYEVITRNKTIADLNEISNKNHSQVRCLILIVLGTIPEDLTNNVPDGYILPYKEEHAKSNCIDIKEIWSKFIHCFTLKNVPKIFLFQIAEINQNKNKFDGELKNAPDHEIPLAADVFVIYKKIDFRKSYEFINRVCERISLFYKRDDILELITHIERFDETPPILISTLRKKCYLAGNSLRGHYYDINKAQVTFKEKLNKISRTVQELEEQLVPILGIKINPTLSDVPSASNSLNDLSSTKMGKNLMSFSKINSSTPIRKISRTGSSETTNKKPWK